MKNWLFAFLSFVSMGLVVIAFAEQRAPNYNYQTTFIAQDDGDSLRPFAVNVGTTIPVLVYFSTQTAAPRVGNYASPDRILTIQNIQTFNLYCSTLSTVNATSGNRFVILSTASGRGDPFFQTYAAPTQIWCIYETAAGSGTLPVLGWVGYDSGD